MKGYLPTYHGCMVCGNRQSNPVAMQTRFYWDGEKIDTEVKPENIYNGYEGVLHGGIISALLDEAMGWAAAIERRAYFVTAELNVRFLKPVPTGKTLRLVCKVVEHKKRYSISEGRLLDDKNTVLAKGVGKFFELSGKDAENVVKSLTFQAGDINVLEFGNTAGI